MPPFDEEDPKAEIITKKNVGVKLSNKDSMMASMPKKTSKEEFVQQASAANETLNSYVLRAAALTPKFGKILRDRVLVENKNSLSIDAERELLANLVQLSIDMNSDPNEIEAAGASAMINMLLHSLLIQRDKINQLDYNIGLLEKKIQELANQK